jgi:hypothetical protein
MSIYASDVTIVRVNCGPQGVKLSKALKYE